MPTRNHAGVKFVLSALLTLAGTIQAQNTPPAFGFLNNFYAIKNTPYQMQFSELVSLTSAQDTDGDPLSFRIEQVNNGTLTADGTAVVPGVTIIESATVLVWTPPTNAFNVFIPAFVVKAYDGRTFSVGTAEIDASIRGNTPPELTFITPFNRDNLENAHINTPYTFTFDALKQQSDLRDADGDPVTFVVDSVTSGSLTVDGQAVIPQKTVIGPTNIVIWTPPADTASAQITAFRVFGYDGMELSDYSVPVLIQVTDPTPHFVAGPNQVVLRDDPGQFVFNWATGIGPDEYGTWFEVTNDNPTLFDSQPDISYDGILTYIVAPSATGTARVSATLVDEMGRRSITRNFTISVLFVNYPPDFDMPDSVTVDENAPMQQIPNFLSNVSPGYDESFQTVSWTVVSTNRTLYATRPFIDANGTLNFKPALNAYGSDLVTVRVKDNGTTANGGQNTTTKTFLLTVNHVNQPPLVGVRSISLDEDSSTNVDLKISDPDNTAQDISVSVLSFDSSIISGAVINKSSGTNVLTLTPAPNVSGKTTIVLSASDGQTNVAYPIAITINAVNDPPSFALQSDTVAVNYAGVTTSVPGFAYNISAGPLETNQTVSFLVTPADASFFATKPTISTKGLLVFKVADGVSGQAFVSVVAKDSGGVAKGGQNLSASQTFSIVVPTNPYPALKGNYVGLFSQSSATAGAGAGFFSATVTDKGFYTGRLMMDGSTFSFSSQFNLQQISAVTVNRKNDSPLSMILSINADGITGTVSDGNWTANITAEAAMVKGDSVPQAGNYTMMLPAPDAASLPGVGTISVSTNGLAILSEYLGDGTQTAASGTLTKNGRWPMYVSLYKGKGSLIGWLTFTNSSTGNVAGNIVWMKQSGATTRATSFTNALDIIGSAYTPSTSLTLSDSAMTLTFAGGASDPLQIPISPLSTFYVGADKLALRLTPTTGLLTGSFVVPGSKVPQMIKGVWLQQQKTIVGFFFDGSSTGQWSN